MYVISDITVLFTILTVFSLISLQYKLCQFFSINHVIDLVRTCVARRANYMRTFIWFAMIALIITNFTTCKYCLTLTIMFYKLFNIIILPQLVKATYSTSSCVRNSTRLSASTVTTIPLAVAYKLLVALLLLLYSER